MDPDESVHNESGFYYPKEETPNETTASNFKEVEQLNKSQDFIHSLRPDISFSFSLFICQKKNTFIQTFNILQKCYLKIIET